MKNRFLILFVLAATFFACNSDSMISEDLDKKAVERPFKIKNLEGTFLVGGDATCATLNAEGEGTVSHLGLSAVVEQWCWNGQPTDLGTRTSVITAANGDELYCRITTIDWPILDQSFIETVEVEGGTGRFSEASGQFTQYVEIQFDCFGCPTGTFIMNAEGTIKY